MLIAFSVTLVVFFLLLIAEILRRNNYIHGEVARKFVHITVGVFVATWPFYLSTQRIQVLCFLFLLAILVSRYFNIFSSIHAIYRKTWGDVLFPVGIWLTAMTALTPWIFAAAILHLSLADGLAAIIGDKLKIGQYKLFGHRKSIAGSGTFLAVSLAVILSIVFYAEPALGAVLTWFMIILLPIGAMLIENISPKGTDNITVPLFVVSILNLLWILAA